MKFLILAAIAIAAFAFVEVERDILVGGVGAPVVSTVGGVRGGVVGGVVGAGVAAARPLGYGYSGLTDFNRDGIPDQFERFGGYGAYGSYYGGYSPYTAYGGYGGYGAYPYYY